MFLKKGNTFVPTSQSALDLHTKLPPGNFLIQANPEAMWIEKIDDFEISHKLYGRVQKDTDRILYTFESRSLNTGVLMSGEKGSGKTLLAKNICAKSKLPVIIINAPWSGDMFNLFLQGITQPAIILMDEFEKVYSKEEMQNNILTTLDGVFPSKKLFLITCNDKYKINPQMKNRPGRIYYFIEFRGLESEFIREYCAENLKDKKHIDRIVHISMTFDTFNFDMLKTLVEEMNRYDEDPATAIRMLNIKNEFSSPVVWDYKLFCKGQEVPEKLVDGPSTLVLNPLIGSAYISHLKVDAKGTLMDEYEKSLIWQPQHIKSIENEGRLYRMVNGDYELKLERPKVSMRDAY